MISNKVSPYALRTSGRHRPSLRERFIFPVLTRKADPAMMRTIRKLFADHDQIEEAWMELEPHVQAIATGFDGWSPDVLREGAPLLAALCRQHIETEESLIYPEASARLGRAGRRALGRELDARVRQA